FPPPLFFTSTRTPALYTLSLHDALPICPRRVRRVQGPRGALSRQQVRAGLGTAHELSRQRARIARGPRGALLHEARCLRGGRERSEEHTSELQSLTNLVCRLLLEKKTPR